jgi:SAM-dependent methyltransferase
LSNKLIRLAFTISYAIGAAGWDTGVPTPEVVELVEGPSPLPPGRALDLGCGTGTNSVYLAKHSWDVTGVDMVGRALDTARHKAATAGVSPRLIEGDVTRLDELGIDNSYTLVLDVGCYHSLPLERRDAYAAGVTRVAAPGARLFMFGIESSPFRGMGVTAEELRNRFTGWRLFRAEPLLPQDYSRRGWPAWATWLFARSHHRAWRYYLELTETGS